MQNTTMLAAAAVLGLAVVLPAQAQEISWWYETANPEQ